MIVLPNAPLTPKLLIIAGGSLTLVLSPESLSLRATFSPVPPSNHADLTQYMLNLRLFLESVFNDIVRLGAFQTLEGIAQTALASKISTSVPWTNVVLRRSLKSLKPIRLHKPVVDWTIAAEIVATIIAIAEAYMKLAADLTNELIEESPVENGCLLKKNLDQKWKLVAEHYKSAILLISFGGKFQRAAGTQEQPPLLFHASIFALFDKVCNIGIQMSLLCKSSWMNRATFTSEESFSSSNNGVLCRVAIWVFNEVLTCQNLIKELSKAENDTLLLGLNYDKWTDYLSVFFKYVTAYSGLFLSIEYYQKAKIGQAIGLLNFSLLTLQSKSLGEVKKKGIGRLRRTISGRRNDIFLANLESLTSLNIDKSVFLDLSGAMLSDLYLLFDQLVLLHLKFTKENDNLRFDTVADWRDAQVDLKWPLGAKIPVSSAREYIPKAVVTSPPSNLGASERSTYF